jgi:hypothetical protein
MPHSYRDVKLLEAADKGTLKGSRWIFMKKHLKKYEK